ncbi:MAG: MBL fold metallo-hydrolase [Mailhella sp.]|nr:MBL fold metallo-hydrolase [Mailhella sp.]
MRIQQIRNATLRIEYAGRTFLTEPWLAGRGEFGTFRTSGAGFRCRPEMADIPMPACGLPFDREQVLDGVDACICTHIHPDHIDMAPDGTVGRYLRRDMPIFAQSMEDARAFVRSGFENVTAMYENSAFDGIEVIPVPARHGTKIPCGPACGVILRHPEEKTLYIAGDTIWYGAVARTVRDFAPGVIVVNACAAELLDEGRLIMDDADVEKVVRAGSGARVLVSHMEAVAHATISREEMRRRLVSRGVWDMVDMPDDGEICEYPA